MLTQIVVFGKGLHGLGASGRHCAQPHFEIGVHLAAQSHVSDTWHIVTKSHVYVRLTLTAGLEPDAQVLPPSRCMSRALALASDVRPT